MSNLILIRHGESLWNKLNLFTGWVDVPLSEKGVKEALNAGELLKYWRIDVIFTSELVRAIQTAMLVMSKNYSGIPKIEHENGMMKEWSLIYGEDGERYVPTYKSWHLNERYYGQLQGLNKDKAKKIYGEEQVLLWRRSYDVAPPGGESLKDTAKRTIPYFRGKIMPELERDKNVLVSAHGNSLRSIVMHIEGLTKEEVLKLNIPTGVPLIYEYQAGKLKRMGYLYEWGYDKSLHIK
ncbi:2,3-bisphosphoglycerate-dependent phosphoglycerate mutase [Thermococcus argininiproducens]|uniref:2,3-bisphosphoglycerate-dependent phosphoglycerate mutase n=1 Tax=Thermococcus argininiproducens TaxID=2866384 RepID=A0A9E7SCD5_9EURY|nr:2,3-bisphosphoglycerate-dependent phosphoglycerate mutase [Thermococcus argininiproducens]USG99276.1 2,3-bisphosphoglycerate-dependent phosphoglycerate mutase [Thermococcus argininiproducens]